MTDILPPKRGTVLTVDGLATRDFAEFLENFSEVLSNFQVGDGDPTGTLETSRKMIFLRQDGGVNTTLYVNELGDGTADGWSAK